MRGKEARLEREKETQPKPVRKRDLHSSQEGAPMPLLKVARGSHIPTHDYRGVLGLSFRGNK